MGLIEDIRKIDPKFAAAIETAKSAQEVLKASPWSWFTAELKKIFPELRPQAERIRGIDLVRVFNLDIGYKHPGFLIDRLSEEKNLPKQPAPLTLFLVCQIKHYGGCFWK